MLHRLHAFVRGDETLALICAGLLGAALVWALAERTRAAGVLLLVASALWVLTDQPFEGPTVLHLARSHGVTVADLPAAVTGAYALVLVARRRPRVPAS